MKLDDLGTMEADDDMIVLVVVDDEEKNLAENDSSASSEMKKADVKVEDLLKTAQKHGEYINIKLEPIDMDEHQYDYLEDSLDSETNPYSQTQIKVEPIDDTDQDADYIPDEENNIQSDDNRPPQYHDQQKYPRRKRVLRSFVAELRETYEELRNDDELLVNTLGRIMKTVKPPPPPKDFYVMNGIMFECVECGVLLDSIPTAARHYQEKHGQRYLVCYACGADFRSTTNLYKHEKRCFAPDADIVLKARAEYLGCKGRGRPYLKRTKFSVKTNKFSCSMCSAVFITKSNLESHENLHRGERPYRCHACPSAYTSHSALSRHTKKHSDAQFICDHCSRSFKIRAALVAHMDTHKPMRKHGCEECNRRFAQKYALRLHVDKVHRNLPPPCVCQICPKRYPRMSLLKAHMKRAHGMSIITRKMFFKTLPTMTELEVKESKVVLKYEDENPFSWPMNTAPIKKERVYDEIDPENNEEYEENEEDCQSQEEMSVDELMQYVTKDTNDSSTNVVYIQNGEVVNVNDDNCRHFMDVRDVVSGQVLETNGETESGNVDST